MQKVQLMLRRRALIIAVLAAVMIVKLYTPPAPAANIVVTNVALKSALFKGQVADVQFNVSWDASWRASWTETTPGATFTGCTNWDAAWIFVKYRCRDGADTNWFHASLSTNNGNHTAPAGSTINVGLSTNTGGTNFGAGVFLYRSGNGNGSWTNTGVKLRWQYGDNGVASTSRVDVCVHAVEMVYVPQGDFYLGDGITTNSVVTNINGQFEAGTSTNPLLITSEAGLTLGGSALSSLGNNNAEGMSTAVDDFNDSTTQTLPAAFPKGYSAFYCMKYEISQGQYADFLNQLTSTQAGNHYDPTSYNQYRYMISGSYPAYTSSAPTRACNYLSWADDAAYADWAGLRPITELEFEKACRGPLYPVTNEYAWGSTNLTQQTGFAGGADGSGTETAIPASANCTCRWSGGGGYLGPVRVGIYATGSSSRQDAGASYWGIMELSGSAMDRLVGVGNAPGRLFTGVHGDGKLNSSGDADVSSWPTAGAGYRGGCCYSYTPWLRLAGRASAAQQYTGRGPDFGWRGGRTAP